MNPEEAGIILDVLDIATDGTWPGVVNGLKERGYTPEEVCDAWKKLAKIAGRSGMSPSPDDF